MTERGVHNQEAVLDEYIRVRDEYTITAVCGRNFISVDKLKVWMRVRLGRLIEAAYDGHHRIFPPKPERINTDHDCCLVVFAILLDIKEGHRIHRFLREVTDKKLPIELKYLKTMRYFTDEIDLAEKFYKAQWRFCPAKFEFNVGRDYLNENQIIPICRKKEINTKGRTAVLSMVMVPEEFVGQDLRNIIKDSGFSDKSGNLGYCYQFALKTFREVNKRFFDNEQKAFEGLGGNPGMVRYLADYVHNEGIQNSTKTTSTRMDQNQTTNFTYNILLEYGEGDLDERFMWEEPPVLEKEIELFWNDLFEVSDAVDRIHNLKIPTEDGVREYHGWHADIKPDNILRVREKFKLADPGFATFIEKTNGIPEELVTGGTETFGGPERHLEKQDTSTRVSQAIDIWSLGCVFSVAATWVVLGYKGVREFDRLRRRAIENIIKEQENRELSQGQNQDLITTHGDRFHNGIDVLPEVTSWHDFLRSSARRSDTITNQVLNLVDGNMLLGKPEDRMTAKEICWELKKITAERNDQRQKGPAESVMKILLEVDTTATGEPERTAISVISSPQDPQLTISEDRKLRKSKAQNMPFPKTAHRASVLRSTLDAPKPQPAISETLSESPTRMDRPLSHDLEPETSPSRLNSGTSFKMQPRPHGLVIPRNLDQQVAVDPFHSPPSTLPNWEVPPQNVYQARELLEESNRWYKFGKPRKDPLLTKYFRRNRDIKFLVDNAETMKEFWYEATYLLETLVMKARGQHQNGMDLSFTSGPVTVQNEHRESNFVRAMRDPRAHPTPGMKTDMRGELGDILSLYLDLLRGKRYHSAGDLKNLTIIVLTDGLWKGMSEEDGVDQKITSFITSLTRVIGDLRIRPVSIEFVQFGKDPAATFRLQRLDDNLKPDIIDTEPSWGDVNKMILGSFVEGWDKRDEEGSNIPGSVTKAEDSHESRFGSPTSPFPPYFPPGISPAHTFHYPTSPASYPQPGRRHARTSTQSSIPPIPEDSGHHDQMRYSY